MKKIVIVAGEASGDQHGAHLINQVKQIHPEISFMGIGGDEMRQAGCDIIIDIKTLTVLGVTEIISHLGVILKAMKTIKNAIKDEQPDLVILIDFPDFNLRLAKHAHATGVKILYYISPTIWAWRKNRIKTIKRYVDHIAVIFPFEVELYEHAGVPVTYVGNAIVDKTQATLTQAQAREHYHIDTNSKAIALLPGSRHSEIKRMLPTVLAAANLLKQHYQNVKFLLPLAKTLNENDIHHYTKDFDLDLTIVKNDLYNAIIACDGAICVSGTITMEVAKLLVPQVIIYKTSALSYKIGKMFIKAKYIGMCNNMLQKQVAPELIQDEASPEKIVTTLTNIIDNEHNLKNHVDGLINLKQTLSIHNTKKDVVHLALELL